MDLKRSGSGGGEIVEVQGGHVVRATGRKDRHSKVFTAKGPRDRRVRLSAHTAIQFYDVQDRLGYDRPSKAVDWLIKKAKSSIDKLINESQEPPKPESLDPNIQILDAKDDENEENVRFSSSLAALDAEEAMKTFFPMSSSNSNIDFESYPHEIISRTANPSQDLGLSLHPSLHGSAGQADQTLFTAFHADNFQRISGYWNSESSAAAATLLSSHQQRLFLGQGPPLMLSHQPFLPWNHHTDHHHHHQASVFGSHGMIMQGLSVPTRPHHPSASSSSPPNSHI